MFRKYVVIYNTLNLEKFFAAKEILASNSIQYKDTSVNHQLRLALKESEIKEKKNMGESVKGMAKSIGSKANLVVKKSSESLEKSKEAVFSAVDVNGDGQIDIEDVILMAFKVPSVSIKRDKESRALFQRTWN